MKSLDTLLANKKQIRVIGFDDAPFSSEKDSKVNISGIVCANTRFEGMIWGHVSKDGTDSTQRLIYLLKKSKFYHQVNLVLIDGIAFGGFNIVNLPELSTALDRPCIAVMRKPPDFKKIFKALEHFQDSDQRIKLIYAAGPIHHHQPFYFQTAGCDPEIAGPVLWHLTFSGNVPEALRIAHMIGSAVKTGQSSNRA